MKLLQVLEEVFEVGVRYGILLMEFVGVMVILITAVKSIIQFCNKASGVRLTLASGIALALEFKLGGEVLRTVVVREWSEILLLGAIISIRAALTLLIHWEIKHENNGIGIERYEISKNDAK